MATTNAAKHNFSMWYTILGKKLPFLLRTDPLNKKIIHRGKCCRDALCLLYNDFL